MTWLQAGFYIGVLALVYCYIGYPVLLGLLAGVARRRTRPAAVGGAPSVAILLSVYNEEFRIEAKIKNFRAMDYPGGKLELWIGLDGCTDGTGPIVRAAGDDRIRCVSSAARAGKTAMLNRLAARAGAEILVFTDVNAMFRPAAVRELAAAFDDPRVGLVSGRTASGGVEGAYYRYETRLRILESAQGRLSGADGAIYAMRRSLYRELAPELINDFSHPCEVVLKGYAAAFAPAAVCDEAGGGAAGQEMRRQIRMVAQAFHVYARYIGRLLAAGQWRFAWMLTSHKLLRWLGLIWLLLAGAGTAALAAGRGWAQALLAAEAVLVALAAAGAVFPRRTRSGVFQLPLFFLLVNFAYFRGFLKYLAGERYVTWEPGAN